MVVRIVLFLLGAAFSGGGGYLVWLNRASAQSLFPMDPKHAPWMLIGGMAGVAIGVVLLVWSVAPRTKSKAAKAAEQARRDAAIKEADSYYSSRAQDKSSQGKSPQAAQNRAADRDWRSGDIPPPPPPRPAAQPQPPPQQSAPQPRAASPIPPLPIPPPIPPQAPPRPQPTMQAAPPQPAAQPAPRPAQPPTPEPVAPARPATVKPSASAAPPVSSAATPFPAQSTLSPMPRASDPPAQAPRPAPAPPLQSVPPAQAASAPAAAPKPAAAPSGNPAFDRIRALIGENKLDEAEKILGEERERLTKTGDAGKVGLAELTALAGDHAAAAGRSSNAKWLWRLALKRFQEAEAMSAPAAKAVSERLRLADQ